TQRERCRTQPICTLGTGTTSKFTPRIEPEFLSDHCTALTIDFDFRCVVLEQVFPCRTNSLAGARRQPASVIVCTPWSDSGSAEVKVYRIRAADVRFTLSNKSRDADCSAKRARNRNH